METREQLQEDVRLGRIGVERLLDVIGALQRQLEKSRQELELARQRIEEQEARNPKKKKTNAP